MTDERWLRIGEVSRLTGLTHRTLRHYDDLGLLVPSGRSYSDYRLYAEADMERLLAIQHLKSLGLSLDEVARVLDDPGADAAEVLDEHIVAAEERLAAEQARLTRLRRLRGAAETGWEDVLGAINQAEQLQHPDASVRFRAALLGHESATVEDLVDRLSSDPAPEVREAATWALVQRGAAAIDAIAALADGDEQSRLALAHALGKFLEPAGVPTLGRLLADPAEAVAVKAAFSLGQIGGEEAAGLLVAALRDERVRVREEATASLARLPEAGGLLLDAAAAGPVVARVHAVEALATHADPAAVPVLVAALQRPEPDVAYAALLALGQRSEPDALAAIRDFGQSTDARIRAVAQRLLADQSSASRSARNRRAMAPSDASSPSATAVSASSETGPS